MSQHTGSSSTPIFSPDLLLKGLLPTRKPDLKLDIASFLDIDKRMSGKGFIEPHRNNLPRRKRRNVTAPVDSQTLLPTSEAGPRSLTEEESYLESHPQDGTPETTTTSVQTQQTASSSSSSSLDTNITEPPSSLRATPLLQKSPFSTFRPSKRALFHDNDIAATQSPSPLITPSKGHLQPTCATLPRRNRSLAQVKRRRTIAEQAVVPSQPNDARQEVSGQRIRRQSICAQQLVKGLTLGFLTEGDDENVVRIKVYDESSTPLSSSIPSSASSLELLLQAPIPPTDGTTSLTDSQIQQACMFIEAHILSTPESSSNNNNNKCSGGVSVLILTPRMRPEEAMSIGASYLAGMEEIEKSNETQGDEGSDNHDDYAYSTVHRLLMAFHDDPGSPILNYGAKPDQTPIDLTGGWKGLRSEWRGVLSFDGMQRLDGVWTSSIRDTLGSKYILV